MHLPNENGSSKPNWVLLAYLVSTGLAFAVTVGLCTIAVGLRIIGWFTGQQVGNIDALVLWSAVIALGVLPWTALLALARALFLPTRVRGLRVETRSVGKAAVILTALNDEESIEDAVRDFLRAPSVGAVIVVDNGSTDRTRDLAMAAGAQVVIEHRRGYGHACMRGLAEGLRLAYPVTILCEGDRTFRAEDVEKFIPYLKHADLVVGSRTHPTLLNGDSQLNSFFTLGNVIVAKLLQLRYWNWSTGGQLRLTDLGCTYRAIRTEAIRRMLPALEVGGLYFGPHMVMVALEHGLRIIEIPVTFWKRVGKSKGGNANWREGFVLGLTMIWHILTYRVRVGAETASSTAAVTPVASSSAK